MIACDQEVKRVGFSIDNLTGLTLGQQGENLVNTIRIDMTPWMEAYENLSVYALHIRHGELIPYMAPTAMEENELVWPVTSVDTGIQGIGMVQIIGTNGTTICKSKTIRTLVGSAVPGSDEEGAPTIYSNTSDEFLAELTQIRDAALVAQTAAEAARTGAETAKTAAQTERTRAEAAKNSAQIIVNALSVDALSLQPETTRTAQYAHSAGALFLLKEDGNYSLYLTRSSIARGATLPGSAEKTSFVKILNEMRGIT